MGKRRSNVKRDVLKYTFFFSIACLFIYTFVGYKYGFQIQKTNSDDYVILRNDNASQIFYIKTTGCKIPSYEVLDNTILNHAFSQMSRIDCQKTLFTSDQNGLISTMRNYELLKLYNVSDIDQIMCEYAEIRRKDDQSNEISEKSFIVDIRNRTQVNTEFIRIQCRNAENQFFYKDYHLFAPRKRSRSKSGTSNDKKISILILGINNLSRSEFHRDMPQTAKLLLEDLNGVEFFGHTKVGKDTDSNLIPILTGLDRKELSSVCLINGGVNATLDGCPFIWKRFRDHQYQTAYGENVAESSFLSTCQKGFNASPTDYYLRPIVVEMEKKSGHHRKGNIHLCQGGRKPSDILLEFMQKLAPLYPQDNFFSFFWLSTADHHFVHMPPLIDGDVTGYFTLLNRTGVLNRTIVLMLSDRGATSSSQKGYQGILEERLPLLIALFPEWFNSIYPLAMTNIVQNAKKLTTHFDIFSTLADLLNLRSLSPYNIRRRSSEFIDGESMPRGISLFLNISALRTCQKAGIGREFCTCYKKRKIATNDARVQRVARFLVHRLNKMLNPYPQCRGLYLNSIFEATIGSSESNILHESQWNALADITARLQTKPGFAEYEATVRVLNDQLNLTGPIRLVSSYSRQGYCIDDYAIKKFCYCEK